MVSAPNAFSLFRQYEAETFPSHDPEDKLTPDDLMEAANHVPQQDIISVNRQMYGTYSNKSSFLLREWFWNGSVQKSKRSFNDLVNIISSSHFRPQDI
jgi:hypothetical protein